MSQYTIKLEQLISSQSFGDIVLTIQYDFIGAKIISIQGQQITAELNSQLLPVLNIFNFCLTKGIPATEVVEQMALTNQSTQLDVLLSTIMESIKNAPTKIQDIQQGDVIEIDSTVLKHLR